MAFSTARFLVTFAAIIAIPMKSWFVGAFVWSFCIVTSCIAIAALEAFSAFFDI